MGLLEGIESLISDIESTIYIGNFPPTAVNNICTIYNAGGREALHSMGEQTGIRQPSIQIRVRDESHSNGYNRCNAIIDALDGLTNQTADDLLILLIVLETDIMDIGKSDRNLSEFTFSFKLLTQST